VGGDAGPVDPVVSVVIPTFRRDALLRRCVDRVLRQKGVAFEVIVVDDARGATVPLIVAEMEQDASIPLASVTGPGKGPAAARNAGWRAARGNIIAFCDDDAYPQDDAWLANGLRGFVDESIGAVTGRVIVPSDEPPTDFQRNVKRLESARFLTCNAFVRRSVLEAVGGFDERFGVPFREDSDLQFSIEAAGWGIAPEPAAVVVHPAVPGDWGISLRLQKYSMYNALIFKKHPARYGELAAGPPLNYYAMLGLLAGAAIFAILGLWVPAAFAFLGWLSLEVLFFARRMAGASSKPGHVADMVVTSLLIPPLSVYWRLRGAWRFRVLFV
jgi:cellulose synthase/poly-beta-1,6-N-acetylglucosamine synthase-like glycosyltransferase